MNRLHTLIAGCLYVMFFFLLFPGYHYYIDLDGISYVKAADRIAAGNITDGINGYWSPLPSFILVPFIKLGFNPVIAAKYINGVLGLLCLFSFSKIFSRFPAQDFLKKIVPYVLSLMLLSFCFYELCADLLAVLILSLYLNIIFAEKFLFSHTKLIALAALGALAYFAKAYNFYFFLAHISVVICIYAKQHTGKYFSTFFLKRWFIVLIAFFIFVFPYVFFITVKYNQLTINTAGKLNSSWVLQPGFTDSQRLVIPPPYPGAVSNWDDPTYQQKATVSAFTSKRHFVKQIKVTASNTITLGKLLTAFSITGIPVLLLFFFFNFIFKKEGRLQNQLLFFTAALIPAGYLVIIIEDRYIWLSQILLLLITSLLISGISVNFKTNRFDFKLVSFGLICTFCYKPLLDLGNLYNRGKYEHQAAQAMFKNGITGNFFTKVYNSRHQASVSVITYLTNSRLYGAYKMEFTKDELQQAVKQYNLEYVVQLYERDQNWQYLKQTEAGQLATKTLDSIYPNLLIFKMNE